MTTDQPLKKGQLLVVKTPPLFNKEYFYEVTSAGDKLVRAGLYHSPKVKRSWTTEELKILMEMGMVRLAVEGEKPCTSSVSDLDSDGDADSQ